MDKYISFLRNFQYFLLVLVFSLYPHLDIVHAAQVPPQIFTYQGRLADSGGTLLGGTGTTYYFKFSIWDNATIETGTQLWPADADPASVSATVRQGVFTVNIGDTANGYPVPLNLNFSSNSALYLQVRASSNNSSFETLSPRQRITSAVFAQLAGAIVGTTTPSTFGTTTPATNSFVTIAATSTASIPLTIVGFANQVANLFQIQNNENSNLFSVNAAGGITAVAATTTSFFATTASSTNLSTSNLSIGSLSGFLKATAGAVTTALVNLATDVTGTLPVTSGGTGSTTLTGILKGNGTNQVGTLVVGSGLAFDGTTLSALAGTAASSTLLGDTNTFSGNNTFSNLITGSVSGNAGTVTNGVYTTTFGNLFDNRLAATSSVNSITTLSNLSITKSQVSDFGTYEAPLTFSYPLSRPVNAVSLAFGTTTSNTWANTQTFTNAPTLATFSGLVGANTGITYAVSTSTLNIGGNAATVTNGIYTTDTGTVTNTMLAGSIIASKLSLAKGNFLVGNDAGIAQATSTIFISSTGNLGVGTSSPFANFSVHSLYGNTNSMLFAVASSSLTATTTLFSVDRSGLATFGDSSGTDDANFQFASDANAWTMGYNSTNKSFNIASSTNLSASVALTITKGASLLTGISSTTPWRTLSINGTVALNGLSAVSGTDSSICLDPTTLELTTQAGDTCAVSSRRFKNTIDALPDTGLYMLRTLRPVSFRYNDDDAAGTTHWGFIAEETASTSPQLAYFNPDGTVQTINSTAILSLAVKALGELDLNLLSIASTTATSTEESRSFANNFFNGIFSKLVSWFADAANGVGKFFASEVHTDTLCVKKSDGTDICLTGDQLANLLAGQSTSSASVPTPEPTPAPEPISEPASAPEPSPELTPEPVVEPTQEPTPEPTLEPTSADAVSSDATPTDTTTP